MARPTFATPGTLSNGMPIETVSKLVGHSKIATTQIYAKVIERKVSIQTLSLCSNYALSMLYLCSIYALSMLYLCSIYALSILKLCFFYIF
jgi:hypothetical protein